MLILCLQASSFGYIGVAWTLENIENKHATYSLSPMFHSRKQTCTVLKLLKLARIGLPDATMFRSGIPSADRLTTS
jgi:hypothetical protein